MQSANPQAEHRLLDVREAAKRTAMSVRWVWRETAAGRFPKPLKLGSGRAARWSSVELDQWIADQLLARDGGRGAA